MLKLRAHHINCLFFYKGLGYDDSFTMNMYNLKHTLLQNPSTIFMLTNECDNICSKCPNKSSSNLCISNEKVLHLDNRTLMSYNLEINKYYNFQFIVETIYKNFDPYKFQEICKTCEWYQKDVCSKHLISKQKLIWPI